MVHCSTCGTAVRTGAKFCTTCGAAVAQPCPACHHLNLPTDRFCADCGAALAAPLAEAPRPGSPRGQLTARIRLCRLVLQPVATGAEPAPALLAAAALELGDCLRERNDLRSARDCLGTALAACRQRPLVELELLALTALARVQLALGDGRDASDTLAEAEHGARHHRLPALAAHVAAHRARCWLSQGNLGAVERWVHDRGVRADADFDAARADEYTTLVRALTALGRPSQALGLLERLLQQAETDARHRFTVELLALQAPALHADGARRRAGRVLERALALAEPEGYVRLFVDERAPMAELLAGLTAEPRPPGSASAAYLRSLLSAIEARPPAEREPRRGWLEGAVAPLVEPLGEREREVLRLIAAGRSNDQIARELILAVGTVKWYIRGIYAKLDVHSRTQAVARATELRLLSPSDA